MKYRLLCIDIDGTLLNDEKEIPQQVRAAIQKAVSRGLQVALITGRMPAATAPVAGKLQVPCIMACNAGTYILENGQCLSAEYLSADAVRAVYKTAEKYNVPLWIFRHEQWYVTDMDDYIQEEIDLVHYIPEIVNIDTLITEWEKDKSGPNKVLIGAGSELIKAVYAELREQNRQDVEMACSAETFLEIFPKGMNKGKALQLICGKAGIRKEETIAFGDQELDIPMLMAAGVGIAMGNAIAELKETADFVTKTNNEAGIAYALDYYLNQED